MEFAANPAVLVCAGDESQSTQGLRRRALVLAARTQGDVTVDLRKLSFADHSLVLDLAVLAQRSRRHGSSLILTGARPQVLALIKHTGLNRLPAVHMAQADRQSATAAD
ncbi:MAG: STAS domain-containing protein [Solirubrobacteraceae bacterium]